MFSPRGGIVVTFDANSQPQLTLPETGTYVVQVYASNLVSTGSYTLGRECLLPTSPVDATLACGGLVARTIVTPAQVDQITFVAQANDRLTLTLAMSGFPSFVAARATVFSPSGGVVVTFDANSQQQLTLSETGTYVVQVYASNLVSTGSYTLGRECLLPTNPVDATLACGGLVARTIVTPAQVDQITFVAQANDRVTLTLAMSSFPSFVAARATVFSPSGGVVVTFDANSQPQLTLPETGTYVVQVYASNLVSTGSYTLGRECLLPTSAVDATLACGGLVARTIVTPAQVDQITFVAQANDRVTLTLAMSGFPSFVAARATVFSPSGGVVVTFDANSQQQLTLPETGTYIVQVYASNLVSTGSYTLGRECLLPTSAVDATLACGGLVARTIVTPAQVDQITFVAQANDRVTLTLAMSSFPSFVAARATVFSPTAGVVVTFDANSQQQLTLPETGTYIVQVYASNLVSTGSYTLGRVCSP